MKFALRNKETGKFIAIDYSSGGYPYDVDSIWQAALRDEVQSLIKYTAVMSWKDYDNPIYEIVAVLDPEIIEYPIMPTGEDLEATRYTQKG